MIRNSTCNLATNFQDLVAKVKNLVALVPVLGAILHPADIKLLLTSLVTYLKHFSWRSYSSVVWKISRSHLTGRTQPSFHKLFNFLQLNTVNVVCIDSFSQLCQLSWIYLGVFHIQTESSSLPYESPNLPDKTNKST